MRKPKVAVVAVANHFESGGERGEELLSGAAKALDAAGMDIVKATKMVWDTPGALEVADFFAAAAPDLLVIIHASWVQDTIQYLFVNSLSCPLVLWAVPFMETYSLGCIQHFGSILSQNELPFRHVYGLPKDEELIEEINKFAEVAAITTDIRRMRIGLIGPRDTWRVANAQDMSQDEWDFSRVFGATIVHIEIDELIDLSDQQPAADVKKVVDRMKAAGRICKLEVDGDRLLKAARVYLGAKELFRRYRLDAATAECYPRHGGLVNVASSWLAEEGIVLDSEGDIGHSMLLTVLYRLGTPGPAALSEAGGIDPQQEYLYLDHEGSSALSLAEDPSEAVIQECGDGSLIGFPFKTLPLVTFTDLCGTRGCFRLLIARGSTEQVEQEKWSEIGRLLLIKSRTEGNARQFFDKMLSMGVDHHLLVKEGDVTRQLSDFCDLFKVQKVEL